ncbi:hypothetical protein ABR737_01020 [Streptomyces sp. Edi2]|uniref:hypothetical protein n=1 Tax=Streptomyces sp. Edi2 TaxID=3162528 RepID=UPI003305A230
MTNETDPLESIKARMAQVRLKAIEARANGDSRAESTLDGELSRLGQMLRNLRPAPRYPDDRCCTSCR